MWDMKYAPVNVPPSYPISATYMNTEPDQTSPWVMPGTYTARLIVEGKTQSQTFSVKMDPRVKTSTAALQQQHDLSVQCYENRKECMKLKEEIRRYKMKEQNQLTKELETSQSGFSRLMNAFASVHAALQESDMPATTQQVNAAKELQQQLIELKKKWNELKKM
jgi:predicted RNase H-like nuclease (RuvC/YqgF family)